jgi:hypothetical protein
MYIELSRIKILYIEITCIHKKVVQKQKKKKHFKIDPKIKF